MPHLNSQLSQSWILTHGIKTWSHGKKLALQLPGAAWNVCSTFRLKPRKTGNQVPTRGYVVQWPELPSLQRLMKHKDASSFLSTPRSNQPSVAASAMLLHFSAQEESQLEKARKTCSKSFIKNSLNLPLEHSTSNITSFPFFLYLGMVKRGGGRTL